MFIPTPHSPARILIACDKFKGSLDAVAVCAALASGLAARFPHAAMHIHPIADGGEGFAASLENPLRGRWIEAPAHDALGRPVRTRYLIADSADGPLAVIEMAEAAGMWRIRPEERDILRASTFGTGEMMRHAIEQCGARRLVIGLGGSATNDGGAGMAAALGVRFLDEHDQALGSTPMELLGRLVRIEAAGRMSLPPITAACDVDSPLLGNQGATRVFGPQKGADDASIPMLENMLETIVRVSAGMETACSPGAGAAGGLGFGLMHFAGARLEPGFGLLASLTGLEDRVAEADLVVTGEGSLDVQSLSGKGPVAIARLARRHGKPVIAFCGRTDAAARECGLFDSITELAATGLPVGQLMSRTAELLESAALRG
jgi:glycerate kinase